MENNELITDTGLFVGQKLFEFSLAESFETITNLFQTIQQYREFANPDDASAWFEYVHQIFHILGFNTLKIAPRLITLLEMGSIQDPKALVCIIGPHENFEQIIYGLRWESYLFYAARFHQTDWVILTNGLQFKVLNYSKDADTQKYFKCEFDEIVKKGKADNFFTIYRVFTVINNAQGAKLAGKTNQVPRETGDRKLSDLRIKRREFWTKLLALSKGRTKLLERRSPGIGKHRWIGVGKWGFWLDLILNNESAEVILYIDRRDKSKTKNAFDILENNKKEIEESLGGPLVWDRLDDNRVSIIRYFYGDSGLQDRQRWPELQGKMIEAMINLEKVFRPYIKKIR